MDRVDSIRSFASILFIKSELHFGSFMPLRNLQILYHKISTRSNTGIPTLSR